MLASCCAAGPNVLGATSTAGASHDDLRVRRRANNVFSVFDRRVQQIGPAGAATTTGRRRRHRRETTARGAGGAAAGGGGHASSWLFTRGGAVGACAGAGAVRWHEVGGSRASPSSKRRSNGAPGVTVGGVDDDDIGGGGGGEGLVMRAAAGARRRRLRVLSRAMEGTSSGGDNDAAQASGEAAAAVGAGAAAIPVDATLAEEAARKSAKKLGWDTAMSRATLLQLATCAATGVAEPLLGSIDTFWVATLGTTALAALGPNTCVYSSVIAVVAAHGFGTAATRVMAVALEEDEADDANNNKKRDESSASASASLPQTRAGSSMVAVVTTTLAFGLMCAAVLLTAPDVVVKMVGAPPTVVGPAADYLAVRALGVPAVCLIAVLGGAFQAARDARTPFLAVLLAGSANLVLDPLCIFTFNMGFRGAAAATVIAQYASAILMAWFAFCGPRRDNFFGKSGGGAGGGESTPLSNYSFDPALAWSFAKEVSNMMVGYGSGRPVHHTSSSSSSSVHRTSQALGPANVCIYYLSAQ